MSKLNSRSDKTKVFRLQGALYSSMLVELMHNSITSKEKNAKLIPSKITVKVSFVTPEMEKMGKMDFVYCYTLLISQQDGLTSYVSCLGNKIKCLSKFYT